MLQYIKCIKLCCRSMAGISLHGLMIYTGSWMYLNCSLPNEPPQTTCTFIAPGVKVKGLRGIKGHQLSERTHNP
uniref:Uncharacterized protein n=1 Tax=Anguilla anguilla TaxID=7936 RepID=A0A0E9XEH6_ANGAN